MLASAKQQIASNFRTPHTRYGALSADSDSPAERGALSGSDSGFYDDRLGRDGWELDEQSDDDNDIALPMAQHPREPESRCPTCSCTDACLVM
jgi:hypothetical protein